MSTSIQALTSKQSQNNDYDRLMQLCSSYGLNEEETNQIISDFRNGSFAHHDQSFNQSFQSSVRNIDHLHDNTESINEEISFKNHKNSNNFVEQESEDPYKEQESCREGQQNYGQEHHERQSRHERHERSRSCSGFSDEMMENFVNQRRNFEQNLYRKIAEENQWLKEELRKKDEKIQCLVSVKNQDSDTISGLKNSIINITNMFQQKNQAYKLLAQKYEKLKQENEGLSTQKSSKVQLSSQESLGSFQERRSLQKQNCLTEVDLNRPSLAKKSSQKFLKENIQQTIPKVTQQKNFKLQQNKQKNRIDPNKRTGIDISKYKGMIQKLRNSYEINR